MTVKSEDRRLMEMGWGAIVAGGFRHDENGALAFWPDEAVIEGARRLELLRGWIEKGLVTVNKENGGSYWYIYAGAKYEDRCKPFPDADMIASIALGIQVGAHNG